MSFDLYLEKSLKELQQGATFEIYNIKTELKKCSKPLIKQHEGETSYRHRLILVSTEKTGFLCGLETYEYVLSKQEEEDQHIVYISKVDTTTTLKAYSGLTARVVQSYISSLPSQTSVFVFARAQPQYLFAKSAENKDKKVMSDRELVSWWLYILNKVPVKCSGWWSVPGIDDESCALIEVGARRRGWKSSDNIKWSYGISYEPNAKANLVIPRFDDDAKSRLLKSMSEEDLTVTDFWNLIAFGEECGSGKIAGFFELRLQETSAGSTQIDECQLNSKDFTLFWNKFMSLDFSNDKAMIQSTNIAKNDIKDVFPTLEPVQMTTVGALLETNNTNTDKRQAVNMLSSSFIKRKKKL